MPGVQIWIGLMLRLGMNQDGITGLLILKLLDNIKLIKHLLS